MTACPSHLGDPDGLACTRDDGHPDGHVFHGTWCDDAERDEE